MLAHLASLLPFGNVAVRINFSSALFAALACAMLTLVVAELIITASSFARPKRTSKAAQQSRKREDLTGGRVFDIRAGGRRGTAHGIFPHALVVCDDHGGLCSQRPADPGRFLSNAWLAATNSLKLKATKGEQVTIHDGWLYAAAFIFGLAMGVHHVTVGLTLPAVAALVYRTQGPEIFYEPTTFVCGADFNRRH